jgi:hypothetical protein
MKKWGPISYLCIVFHGFIGCNTPKQPAEISPSQKPAQLTWKSISKDLGKISMGDTALIDFPFTNSGDSPLFITSVDEGCSCLQAKGPDHPILPRQTDSIRVAFYTQLSVTGWVRKSIQVSANTIPNTHRLLFSAEITGHKK